MPKPLIAGRVACRTAAALAVALMLAALRPAPARAQSELARADSLLRAGRMASAESLLYDAVRRRPRDPAARLALGRYLAARGALKVGAVLIEEARFFGLPPAQAAMHLAPLYARLDAWPALASLEMTLLSAGERQRASWLAEHPPVIDGPDSAIVGYSAAHSTAPYEPASFGVVVLRFGRDSVLADLDPDARGVVLDRSRAAAAGVRLFTGGATDERQSVGVLARAQLGGFSFTNLPVSFARLGGSRRARIGLDFLGRFAPSFDPARRAMTLRRSGRIANTGTGTPLPLLLETRGSWVVRSGRLESVAAGGLVAELARTAWTLDARRGRLVIGN